MNSASDHILRRIRGKKRGWVFTPKNFIDLAPRVTIAVTLYRLLHKGIIASCRISPRPQKHPSRPDVPTLL